MSSTSSEINALATTTAIDIYKRNKKNVTDDQLVKSTKFFTFLWGIIAIGIACVAYLADNLIQLVNIIGSFLSFSSPWHPYAPYFRRCPY